MTGSSLFVNLGVPPPPSSPKETNKHIDGIHRGGNGLTRGSSHYVTVLKVFTAIDQYSGLSSTTQVETLSLYLLKMFPQYTEEHSYMCVFMHPWTDVHPDKYITLHHPPMPH